MCLLAAGNTIVASCNTKSGLKAGNIWAMNLVDVTLTVTAGVATAITLGGSTLAYRLEMNKKGNNIMHTFVPNDYGSGTYTHTADLRSVENKATLKKLIESTLGATLVLVEQCQDGTFLVAGYGNGLSLNKDDFSMADDALGHTWSMTSEEEPDPLLHLLVTDEAGTLAALVALES